MSNVSHKLSNSARELIKKLDPNFLDPKLTRPKLFQTKRTRRLACRPSFCELVFFSISVTPYRSVLTVWLNALWDKAKCALLSCSLSFALVLLIYIHRTGCIKAKTFFFWLKTNALDNDNEQSVSSRWPLQVNIGVDIEDFSSLNQQ